MSSLLTTTCASCGPVDVPLDRAVLRVGDACEGAGTCVMRCPSCGRRIEREANELMADALLLLGIEVSPWRTRPRDGVSAIGPIDVAELAQFRQMLGHETDPMRWL